MEEKLFEYEDMLMAELEDIMAKRRAGQSFTEQDICNGEKILKSMEHIERIAMMGEVSPEEDLMYGNNNGYSASYRANQYGNSRYGRSNQGNQYGANYSNNMSRSYSGRRYGHTPEDFRMEIQERLSRTNDPNEKLMLNNWLNELNGRQ